MAWKTACTRGHATSDAMETAWTGGHATSDAMETAWTGGHVTSDAMETAWTGGQATSDAVETACTGGHATSDAMETACTGGHVTSDAMENGCTALHAVADPLFSSDRRNMPLPRLPIRVVRRSAHFSKGENRLLGKSLGMQGRLLCTALRNIKLPADKCPRARDPKVARLFLQGFILKNGKTTSVAVTIRKTTLINAFSRKNAFCTQLRLRRRASQCSSTRQPAIITMPMR